MLAEVLPFLRPPFPRWLPPPLGASTSMVSFPLASASAASPKPSTPRLASSISMSLGMWRCAGHGRVHRFDSKFQGVRFLGLQGLWCSDAGKARQQHIKTWRWEAFEINSKAGLLREMRARGRFQLLECYLILYDKFKIENL